jgi:tetratricopeptide (TPR) repeat protein
MSPKQKRPTIPSRKQAPKGLNSDKECASLLQEALPFHQKGRLQEARELYQNILSLNPKYFDALHLLAVLEGQSGDHVKAFALFDEAIKINGKSAALFNNRGIPPERTQAVMRRRWQAATKPFDLSPSMPRPFTTVVTRLTTSSVMTRHWRAMSRPFDLSPSMPRPLTTEGTS